MIRKFITRDAYSRIQGELMPFAQIRRDMDGECCASVSKKYFYLRPRDIFEIHRGDRGDDDLS